MIVKFADPSVYPIDHYYIDNWHMIDNMKRVHWETIYVPNNVSFSDFLAGWNYTFAWLYDPMSEDYQEKCRKLDIKTNYYCSEQGRPILKIVYYTGETDADEFIGFVNTTTYLLNDEGKTLERIFG